MLRELRDSKDMAGDDMAQYIAPTRGAKTLPVEDILTGRGFITGKSGSGKSNTASVIAELLLENGYNLSIVDPEGEYYALKEEFELLHVGAGEHCDEQVEPEYGETLAEITLSDRLPVILDVSDYLSEDDAQELVKNYVTALFQKEKSFKQPHLLIVEEMHEFLPQSGGDPPTADIMQRVGKRGRKHGLGIMGMSQRPAAVDKDYITQCDWLVWHRLTWDNDVDQARKIIGDERANEIEGFDAGEAYLITDWDDSIERVQFKQKRTTDAGATPGLEDYHRDAGRSSGGQTVLGGDGESSSGAPEPSTEQGGMPEGEDGALSEALEEIDLGGQPQGNGHDEEEITALERDELESYAARLERRNEILADEVDELRTVLETSDPQTTDVEVAAATNGEPDMSHAVDTHVDTTTAPTPPPRPKHRSGIAGTLVEFVAMLGYVIRVFIYKLRMLTAGRRSP